MMAFRIIGVVLPFPVAVGLGRIYNALIKCRGALEVSIDIGYWNEQAGRTNLRAAGQNHGACSHRQLGMMDGAIGLCRSPQTFSKSERSTKPLDCFAYVSVDQPGNDRTRRRGTILDHHVYSKDIQKNA